MQISSRSIWHVALILSSMGVCSLTAQTQFDPSRAAASVQPTLGSDALARTQQEAISRSLEQENAFAPESPGDPDIGQQLILKRNEKVQPFSIWGDSAGYWTDNAANVSQGKQQDYFYVGGLNAAWQQRLKGRVYGDVYAGQHWYRYDEFSDLDYEAGEASAGILVLLPELANSIFHVQYYYERITQDIGNSPIYQTHNIRVGLQKSWLIDRLNSVNFALLASFALDADPDVLQRHEYSGTVGYNFKFTRTVTFALSYHLGFYDYFNLDGRQDWFHIGGANIVWRPREFVELSGGYTYSYNQSNKDAFDYESQLAGPAVSLKVKF